MDRRNFFRSAFSKGGKAAVKAVDASVNKQASHWIRPPFAINELEFLLACTRCSDCIEACSFNVIFSLSARTGARAAGTPALDLLNKGCHLCEDWRCVTACTTGALILPVIKTDTDNDAEIEGEKLETQQVKTFDDDKTEVEKTATIAPPKLAIASMDTNTCLPYSGPECGACISICPVDGALTLDMAKPIINQDLCTGCGLCRETCITEPKAINIASL